MEILGGRGPYLNLQSAARYCGYAPRTFSEKVREYSIPRRGDEENRFSVFDLDRWMEDPKCFMQARHRVTRNPGGFTPVRV
ncbi:MAG: DNA-binding protein [Desulfovibrio sp.]|jgi:hypothetical protein|nr:DNA-binding protein [Desulfovibrio sp.]